MSALRFRPAEAWEAAAVALFVNAAYRGETAKRGWTTEADILGGQRTDAESVRSMIETPGSRVELACDAAALAGCVHLKKEDDGSCYLGMLTVEPTLQAGGLGKRLLERSEVLAREWGCSRLRMTVISLRAELIAYYERRGYRRTGRTEPFPEHDPRFGLPKVPGLVFSELEKPLPR